MLYTQHHDKTFPLPLRNKKIWARKGSLWQTLPKKQGVQVEGYFSEDNLRWSWFCYNWKWNPFDSGTRIQILVDKDIDDIYESNNDILQDNPPQLQVDA